MPTPPLTPAQECVPKIGDVIRTATPLNCDSLTHRAGDYLRCELLTESSVEYARELVASGRWVIEGQTAAAASERK